MKLCPSCKAQTLQYMYGCGFDYDRWFCTDQNCGYERTLSKSTYPKESEQSHENDEPHISGLEVET